MIKIQKILNSRESALAALCDGSDELHMRVWDGIVVSFADARGGAMNGPEETFQLLLGLFHLHHALALLQTIVETLAVACTRKAKMSNPFVDKKYSLGIRVKPDRFNNLLFTTAVFKPSTKYSGYPRMTPFHHAL